MEGWEPGNRIAHHRQAEQMAAWWMRWLGHPEAAETPVGPDGGIDVTAPGALAQVKHWATRVGAPELQRLFGARGNRTHLELFFFSAAGYSTHATKYAEEIGMVLYVYDDYGRLGPASLKASRLLAAAHERDEKPATPPSAASYQPKRPGTSAPASPEPLPPPRAEDRWTPPETARRVPATPPPSLEQAIEELCAEISAGARAAARWVARRRNQRRRRQAR